METSYLALTRCALAAAAFALLTTLHTTADDTPPPPPIPADDVMDIDAMAARIPFYKDLYNKMCNEVLTGLKTTHPNHDSDPKVQTFARAQVYLSVYGDYYGEDVERHAGVYLSLMDQPDVTSGKDPLIGLRNQEVYFGDRHPSNDEAAKVIMTTTVAMSASDYPALMKLQAYGWAISVLMKYKSQEHVTTPTPILAQLPALVDQWRVLYGTVIAAKLPHKILFSLGASLLADTQGDEDTLNLVIAAIDRSFNENDAANPVKLALDGDYFVNAAWNARGSGFANTVSNNGWQLMSQRLSQAERILTDAYTAHPEEGAISRTMITVELGQGQGRDRMEQWFQRAIKADPDDYAAYKSKEYYLQPRWYGSVDDIVTFGQQCVATNNWTAKIPMIFPVGVAEAAQLDASVYQDTKAWDQLAKVYGDYLGKYPKASMYRTNFANHAYASGHLDTAREQFKILGADYDRSVVSEAEHAQIVAKLGL